jgi:hypothetical protein
MKAGHIVLLLLMSSALLAVNSPRCGSVSSLEIETWMGMISIEEPKTAMINLNSSRNDSSMGTWHTADFWTITVVAVAPLASSVNLLRHLADASDKQQDDLDRTKQEVDLDRTFNPKNANRKQKRGHKLCKFLKMAYSKVLWKDILFVLEYVFVATMFRKF